MVMFSVRTIMLFTLCTFTTLFALSTCFDETTTNLGSQEKYDDLFESKEDLRNQRNMNSDDYWYQRSSSINGVNKYSTSAMQPEREVLLERNLKPAANFPLRFGRASDDKIAKSVPNLPQRFGRYLSGKPNIQFAANLPQRFGRSQYGSHFVQSLATLPLRFGRTAHSDRIQYETNSYPDGLKSPDEDNDRKAMP
ncbi:pro-FMRFamide-related neuropeptide VF [Hyperolius riggenbachi]|uniref:pro-FMRFamide-related neuropeptide VF n=1 Tax=Hyperolius riggenbachi TaxID=752182 RepID=UPI0035A2C61D